MMDLAKKILPDQLVPMIPDLPAAAVGSLRDKFRALLDDVKRDRPEPGSASETVLFVRMSLFGFESMSLLGPTFVDLMRSGLHSALRDLLRNELETAEPERKLALRHLERATHTYSVLVESLGSVMASVPLASLTTLFEEMAHLAAAGHLPPLEEHDRIVARFQLDLLVALDVIDAPLDDLTYWAFRAITGAHKVEAIPLPGSFSGLHGELARVRSRRAWERWDKTEIAEELKPWPKSGSSP